MRRCRHVRARLVDHPAQVHARHRRQRHPGLENPAAQLYPLLTDTYLPQGLIGLVLASMFASTMGMTVSDINTLSAVTQRDILPVLSRAFDESRLGGAASLRLDRIFTVCFTVVTVVVGLNKDSFGDIIGMIITWFGALVGVTGMPLLLGLFKRFRHCDGRATIVGIVGGMLTFAARQVWKADFPKDWVTVGPMLVTAAIYIAWER